MNTLTHNALEAAAKQWDGSAAGWYAHTPQIRAWLRNATDAMLEMAAVGPGAHVLDVAAGSGDQTLDIARRIGPEGHVLATDLSPASLALAQQDASREALRNLTVQVADGADLPVPDAAFDSVVCRLGLMFFPDPLRGLREMHRILRPGGAMCVMVFGRPRNNPCVTALLEVAMRHAGLPQPDFSRPGGLLSLGESGFLAGLVEQAGFQAVAATSISAPFTLPSAADYLTFIQSSASPLQQILSRLSPAAANLAWAEAQDVLSQFTTARGWVGPNELLLVTARR
jgi:ubiquinone/menaquinone biosynthesis C-methylase UbiE